MHLPNYLDHVSFGRYRPLKLPSSCEVGPKRWFLGPRFIGGGGVPDSDMHFQITLTSDHVSGASRPLSFVNKLFEIMWPIFVEFRSATSEIRRQKRKKKTLVKYKCADILCRAA